MTTDNDEIASQRIEIIHDSLSTLSRVIGKAMAGKADPTPEDASAALNAGLSLANALLVAFTELAAATTNAADSVGKLVEIMERDFKTDVAMQAELKADELVKEKSKRSFIGQPSK